MACIKNKKAATHIEMVLSFVIFIGFVIFILAVFNPFQFTSKETSNIENIARKIQENLSVNVDFLTLKLTSPSPDCFYVPYSLNNVVVKNMEKRKKIAESAESEIRIEGDSSDDFFYIYSSKIFLQDSLSGCVLLPENSYSLGLLQNQGMIFNGSLLGFKNEYETNYLKLKNNLEIPASDDFLVKVLDMQGDVKMDVKMDKPSSIKISAKDTPVQLIYKNGTINYALMHIEIW